MHGLTTLARLNAQAAKADAILGKHEVSDKAKAARAGRALPSLCGGRTDSALKPVKLSA